MDEEQVREHRGLKLMWRIFWLLLLAGIGGQAWLYCSSWLETRYKAMVLATVTEDIASRELKIDVKGNSKTGKTASAEDLKKALFVATAKIEQCEFALNYLANATRDAEEMVNK